MIKFYVFFILLIGIFYVNARSIDNVDDETGIFYENKSDGVLKADSSEYYDDYYDDHPTTVRTTRRRRTTTHHPTTHHPTTHHPTTRLKRTQSTAIKAVTAVTTKKPTDNTKPGIAATTSKPVAKVSTVKPAVSTAKPAANTIKPAVSTSKPVVTTHKPVNNGIVGLFPNFWALSIIAFCYFYITFLFI